MFTTPRRIPSHSTTHDAVPGLAAQKVGWAHDPRLSVQIGVDLPTVIGVVPKRDRVDARREQLIGDLRGDPQPAGDVLSVDDDELGRVALAQQREAVEQRAPADAPHEVADEQDADLARRPVERPPRAQPYFADAGRQMSGVSESAREASRPSEQEQELTDSAGAEPTRAARAR